MRVQLGRDEPRGSKYRIVKEFRLPGHVCYGFSDFLPQKGLWTLLEKVRKLNSKPGTHRKAAEAHELTVKGLGDLIHSRIP